MTAISALPVKGPAEQAVRAFTARDTAPRPTFPLVLAGVTVAVLSMHADAVAKYSPEAFWAGVVAAVGLAIAIGRALGAVHRPRARLALALGMPAAGGALVGVLVQALVLRAVAAAPAHGALIVRDLGGLVDTTDAPTWLLAGVVLGAVPALAVSTFLGLAARAITRLAGNDASEGFTVAFGGASGVVAAFGLLVVDPGEAAPLVVTASAASVALLVTLLVDGSRIAFVRRVFAGEDGAFEIVPRQKFAEDASLAPLVAQAGGKSVLVRVDRRPGSYRAAAAEPIALLADTLAETVRPLRRRRTAAMAMLVTVFALGALAALSHGAFA